MLSFWAVSSWLSLRTQNAGDIPGFIPTFAFRFGWEFSPQPLKFPLFFGWMQQSEAFLREGTQRAELDCPVTGPGRTAAAFKGNEPSSLLGAAKIVPDRTQVLKKTPQKSFAPPLLQSLSL